MSYESGGRELLDDGPFFGTAWTRSHQPRLLYRIEIADGEGNWELDLATSSYEGARERTRKLSENVQVRLVRQTTFNVSVYEVIDE